jgi:hypothetical protein
MAHPLRYQHRRWEKGSRKPPGTFAATRGSHLGNPFAVRSASSPAKTCGSSKVGPSAAPAGSMSHVTSIHSWRSPTGREARRNVQPRAREPASREPAVSEVVELSRDRSTKCRPYFSRATRSARRSRNAATAASSVSNARGLPDSLRSMSVSPATTVANPLRHQRRPAWLPPISGTPQNPRDLTIRLTLQGRDVREILDAVKIVAPRPPRLCIGDRPAFGFVHGALPASERACHSGSGRQDAVHTVSTGHRRRQ